MFRESVTYQGHNLSYHNVPLTRYAVLSVNNRRRSSLCTVKACRLFPAACFFFTWKKKTGKQNIEIVPLAHLRESQADKQQSHLSWNILYFPSIILLNWTPFMTHFIMAIFFAWTYSKLHKFSNKNLQCRHFMWSLKT